MNPRIYQLLIIIVVSVVSVVPEENPQSDECTRLILDVNSCSKKFHLPTICDGFEKSELLDCAEKTTGQLPMCQDEVGRKIITHVVDIYRMSDQILCSEELRKEVEVNKQCWRVTSVVATGMTATVRGFLSEKGCKLVKTMMYFLMVASSRSQCNFIMKTYIEGLYSRSPCAAVSVETVTLNDTLDFAIMYRYIYGCWNKHTELPACLDEKSMRVECVENFTLSKIGNPQVRHLATHLIETTQKTDEVICSDFNLRQDFLNSADCWKQVKDIGLLVIGQAHGLYTAEGCEAVKYQEKLKMARVDKRCIKLLREFRKAMDEVSPCVKRPSVSYSYAQSVFTVTVSNQLAIILTILILHCNIRIGSAK